MTEQKDLQIVQGFWISDDLDPVGLSMVTVQCNDEDFYFAFPVQMIEELAGRIAERTALIREAVKKGDVEKLAEFYEDELFRQAVMSRALKAQRKGKDG